MLETGFDIFLGGGNRLGESFRNERILSVWLIFAKVKWIHQHGANLDGMEI